MIPVEENAHLIMSVIANSDLKELHYDEALEISRLSKKDFDQAYDYLLRRGGVTSRTNFISLTTDGKTEYHRKRVSLEVQQPSRAQFRAADPSKVFVVHGRNGKARRALFTFLRALHLKPVEWTQAVQATGKASPYIGEILDAAFTEAQAVVVLLTPDDFAYLREPLRRPDDEAYESVPTLQARPNVLFEAGMAMGRDPDRTVLAQLGTLRPFSDVVGRHTIRLDDNSVAQRQALAQRLQTAGCPVEMSGTDWHTEGDFANALEGL